jgi:hypothetical protein
LNNLYCWRQHYFEVEIFRWVFKSFIYLTSNTIEDLCDKIYLSLGIYYTSAMLVVWDCVILDHQHGGRVVNAQEKLCFIIVFILDNSSPDILRFHAVFRDKCRHFAVNPQTCIGQQQEPQRKEDPFALCRLIYLKAEWKWVRREF